MRIRVVICKALLEGLVPGGVFAVEHTEAYVLFLGGALPAICFQAGENITLPGKLTGAFSVMSAKDFTGVGRI